MRIRYDKPEIKIELLSKADVLLISEQTDNSYVESKDIFKDDFDVQSIL